MQTFPLARIVRLSDRCFLKWASKSGKAPIVQEVTQRQYLDYIGPANRAPLPPVDPDVDPSYPIGGSSVVATLTPPVPGDALVWTTGPGFLNGAEPGDPVVLRVVTPSVRQPVLDIRQSQLTGDLADVRTVSSVDTGRVGTRIVSGRLEVD